jgi:hypothetical protein
MNNRLKNTRIVVFEKDYLSNAGKVLYKAKVEHAIHYKVVEGLEARGVKLKAADFDQKRVDAAKEKFLKEKKN